MCYQSKVYRFCWSHFVATQKIHVVTEFSKDERLLIELLKVLYFLAEQSNIPLNALCKSCLVSSKLLEHQTVFLWIATYSDERTRALHVTEFHHFLRFQRGHFRMRPKPSVCQSVRCTYVFPLTNKFNLFWRRRIYRVIYWSTI